MIVSSFGFMDVIHHSNVSLDPSRVAAGVASGIGFLGAGTIMFRRDMIQGLTTAASLWAVAAVGLAVGGGLYIGTLITTLLVLAILAWVKPIERHLFQNRRPRSLKLLMKQEASLTEVESAIKASNGLLKHLILQPSDAANEYQVEVVLTRMPQDRLLSLIETLRSIPGVREVSYTPA